VVNKKIYTAIAVFSALFLGLACWGFGLLSSENFVAGSTLDCSEEVPRTSFIELSAEGLKGKLDVILSPFTPDPDWMENVYWDENEVPKFISGTFTGRRVDSAESALMALEDIKDIMRIRDVNEEFELEREDRREHMHHYRFQQVYNGIPVYGKQLIVSADPNGKVSSLSGGYVPGLSINTIATLSKEQVSKIVNDAFARDSVSGDIRIDHQGLRIFRYDSEFRLAYYIYAGDDTFMIDAHSGTILDRSSLVMG